MIDMLPRSWVLVRYLGDYDERLRFLECERVDVVAQLWWKLSERRSVHVEQFSVCPARIVALVTACTVEFFEVEMAAKDAKR